MHSTHTRREKPGHQFFFEGAQSILGFFAAVSFDSSQSKFSVRSTRGGVEKTRNWIQGNPSLEVIFPIDALLNF